MLPPERPDRIHVAFDDPRLVANAGLLLPVTLTHHLGLPQLVDRHVDLGRAPGRANTGDKMLTLVASALAGGDSIDDADVLRADGTAGAIGCVVKAPSTLWKDRGHTVHVENQNAFRLHGKVATLAGPTSSCSTVETRPSSTSRPAGNSPGTAYRS